MNLDNLSSVYLIKTKGVILSLKNTRGGENEGNLHYVIENTRRKNVRVGYPFDSGNPNPLWVEVVETRAGAARSALLGPEWRPVRAWTRKSL